MPYVQGFLRVAGGGPDQGLPPGEGSIDNSLPGLGLGGGHIDNSLPPPPGIWPPPTTIWPPIALPPDYPMPPGSIWPPVHPPVAGMPLPGGPPGHVGGGPATPPVRPDAGLPPAPGRPDAGLPPGAPGHAPSGKFLVAIVAAAAGGLKVVGYTVVDPSLNVGMPLPGGPPGHVGGGPIVPPPVAGTPLPPTPEPRRG